MGDINAQYGYVCVHAKGYNILHASYSQDSPLFGLAANNQCHAMCAVAIATAFVLDPAVWRKSTLDKILIKGNSYYNDCIHFARSHSIRTYRVEFRGDYLNTFYVLGYIDIRNRTILLTDHLDLDNIRQSYAPFTLNNVRYALNALLTQPLDVYAIFTAQLYSFAILKA